MLNEAAPAEEIKTDDKGLTDMNEMKYLVKIITNNRDIMPEVV